MHGMHGDEINQLFLDMAIKRGDEISLGIRQGQVLNCELSLLGFIHESTITPRICWSPVSCDLTG